MSTEPHSTDETRRKKVTVRTLQRRKVAGEPISMVTAYEYTAATLIERTDIDCILVGDSLGMVMLGYDSTVRVTMEDMLHHCRAVARGARRPLLIADMPFLSYQVSPETALVNAGRLLSEGRVEAVKLEGGEAMAPTITRLVGAGIPVVGHVGLTPQSVNLLGYQPQGRTAAAARRLLADARALQASGCFAIVLEAIPDRLASHISQQLEIPTIGIGAGHGCDGQVLVWHDLLGLYDQLSPRFVKRYAEAGALFRQALTDFDREVRARTFPASEHAYSIPDGEWEAFLAAVEEGQESA